MVGQDSIVLTCLVIGVVSGQSVASQTRRKARCSSYRLMRKHSLRKLPGLLEFIDKRCLSKQEVHTDENQRQNSAFWRGFGGCVRRHHDTGSPNAHARRVNPAGS